MKAYGYKRRDMLTCGYICMCGFHKNPDTHGKRYDATVCNRRAKKAARQESKKQTTIVTEE